jgi:hypothetical protein
LALSLPPPCVLCLRSTLSKTTMPNGLQPGTNATKIPLETCTKTPFYLQQPPTWTKHAQTSAGSTTTREYATFNTLRLQTTQCPSSLNCGQTDARMTGLYLCKTTWILHKSSEVTQPLEVGHREGSTQLCSHLKLDTHLLSTRPGDSAGSLVSRSHNIFFSQISAPHVPKLMDSGSP